MSNGLYSGFIALILVFFSAASSRAQTIDVSDFTGGLEVSGFELIQPTNTDGADENQDYFLDNSRTSSASYMGIFRAEPHIYFSTNAPRTAGGDTDFVLQPTLLAILNRDTANIDFQGVAMARTIDFLDDTGTDISLAVFSLKAIAPFGSHLPNETEQGVSQRNDQGAVSFSTIFAERDTFGDWLGTTYRIEAGFEQSNILKLGGSQIRKTVLGLSVRHDVANPSGDETTSLLGQYVRTMRLDAFNQPNWSVETSVSASYDMASRAAGDRNEFNGSISASLIRRFDNGMELRIGTALDGRESDAAGRDFSAIRMPLFIRLTAVRR